MLRVDVAPLAMRGLGQVPGLWRRARDILLGILQTAEHARLIGADVSSNSPLRLHLGKYVVTYVLDADRSSATILTVERASAAGGGSDREAG